MLINIKTIETRNAEIYNTVRGDRRLLANCNATIEVIEDLTEIEIVSGYKTKVKDYKVVVVLCEEIKAKEPIAVEMLKNVDSFDIKLDIRLEDGTFKRLDFTNVIPTVIDLNGSWKFSIRNSKEIIDYLRKEKLI